MKMQLSTNPLERNKRMLLHSAGNAHFYLGQNAAELCKADAFSLATSFCASSNFQTRFSFRALAAIPINTYAFFLLFNHFSAAPCRKRPRSVAGI